MSLFKEKDDFITKAFKDQFDADTDDEELDNITNQDDSALSELSERPRKKLKDEHVIETSASLREAPEEKKGHNDPKIVFLSDEGSSSIECICLDGDEDSQESSQIANKNIVTSDRNKTNDSSVVTIPSDDESDEQTNQPTATTSISQQLNSSFDLDDRYFNLKLTLAGTYKQFRTTYKTKLNEALKDLLNELKSQNKELVLTSKGEPVPLDQSPHSLRLTPGTILDAIEVLSTPATKATDPNEIGIILQDGNRRNTKKLRTMKNEPILKLKELYAKEVNIESIDKITFLFDGDLVDNMATPDEMEIEDGCVIDVMLR